MAQARQVSVGTCPAPIYDSSVICNKARAIFGVRWLVSRNLSKALKLGWRNVIDFSGFKREPQEDEAMAIV